MTNTSQPHPLYLAALAADNHYTAVLAQHDLTRWSTALCGADIKAATAAKAKADTAWLDFIRADSLARSARRQS